MIVDQWTVVQHSGFGYADKPGFEHGVETRKVSTKAELDRVIAAGGVVFDSFAVADTFTEEANFPKGYGGLYPAAQGTFSAKKVDDLAIYIPVRTVVG